MWCTDRTGPTPQAYALHERHGVSARVSYHAVDVFDIPFADGAFDVVGCKSVIGGLKRDYGDRKTRTLQNQEAAVREMWRVLRPGGVLLGAENLRGTPVHRGLRWLASRGNMGWRHLSLVELHTLLGAFAETQVRTFGLLGSRSRHEGLNRVTATADALLRPLVPADWCYVGCYIAWK